MTPDTQWPRFMVFEQQQEGHAWRHNGTVHAPDAEMALLNARDVFARRPEAVGMWVVPEDTILSKTLAELADPEWARDARPGERQSYHVFGKFFEQGACESIAEVRADSPQGALERALSDYAGRKVLWWWVFPASAVLASSAEDAGPMFAPARDKSYKSSNEYPVVTMMRQIRTKGRLED